MNATSLKHKLTVIKRSVTAARHAAARPPSLPPEPQPASPGRGGRHPSRPRPLPRRSARRPRPGLHRWCQARASPPCSAGSPEPGSGPRPSLQSWAGPGSHLPIRVGPPARRPGCCHSRGFRLRPEARTRRPERAGSPGDVRTPRAAAPPTWARPDQLPPGRGGGCGGARGGASLPVGGRLGLHRVPRSRPRSPRRAQRSPVALSRVPPSGAEAALQLLRSGASAAGDGRRHGALDNGGAPAAEEGAGRLLAAAGPARCARQWGARGFPRPGA